MLATDYKRGRTVMDIPFCDLRAQHAALRTELDAAIARVIQDSAFILGPEVSHFEEKFAEFIGVNHAIGTSNGTTALMVALKALHIQPGDEVLIPAMTFFATAEAVAFLGGKPVFVDIHPEALTIDVEKIPERITRKTRAIIPVHLYGQPARMDEIRTVASAHHLAILGDCAHAHGAMIGGVRVGGIEDIAAFSFYPSKNLGCLGEAGMITTNDAEYASRCMQYRDHGSVKKYEHGCIGTNARMDGLNAAVLSVKLPHLEAWNEQRRTVARYYGMHLAGLGLDLPVETAGSFHVYHVYQIRSLARDRIAGELRRRGIGVTMHYPVPMHLHKGFSYLGYREGDFPVAEDHARRTLSLPCFPGMTEEQLSYVIRNLKEVVGGM
jgi:dTDP-4-amino-4,6-dideoxygalactose transaminase